ncbi:MULTISPECIES: hypothetical protein [Pirellulaceae]|nr:MULTISPECIES: hypothetical protein [Pirellulaceae]
MRWIGCVILLAIAGCNGQPFLGKSAPNSYRFVVANDELYAVRHGGSYGTESGVLTTADKGDTWTEMDAPHRTISLAGRDSQLVALTSKAELFTRDANGTSWTRLWSDPSLRHTYDLSCALSGDIYLATPDGIVEVSRDGSTSRKHASPNGAMCVRSFFADDHHLVVSCNPFQVAVLDTNTKEFIGWNEGFLKLRDDGMYGPAKVKMHGTRFLASRSDGVYVADGLLQPWQLLNDEIRHEGLSGEFCRDLETFDSHEKWLVATGSGIHLMQGGTKQETVFEDVDDDHNLILEVTPFRSQYFVSFARLKNAIGVRLAEDASEWTTLRLNAKQSETESEAADTSP